jgi:hypothetical protein
MADSQGVVQYTFGAADVWYTDGYGDYIKHFMSAIASVPDWSPAGENHLLRSSSVVKSITYQVDQVSFTTFDTSSREVLKLAFTPIEVAVNGVLLPKRTDLAAEGWVFDDATKVLRIRHDNGSQVVIRKNGSNSEPPEETPDPLSASPSLNFSDDGNFDLTWSAVTWATGYEVQVDTDKNFTLPHYLDTTELGEDDLSLSLPAIPNGVYYWRVRAKDRSEVWHSWSSTQSFKVLIPES